MLEFFAIFTKSGLVLFSTVNLHLEEVIRGLIKHAFLEERADQYHTDKLRVDYRQDNGYDIVFVVAYQKLQPAKYVDKLLDCLVRAFRHKYPDYPKSKLDTIDDNPQVCGLTIDDGSIDFTLEFGNSYNECLNSLPKQETMRTFSDSAKSKKTIASMIVQPNQPPKEPVKAPVKETKTVPPASIMARFASKSGDTKVVKKAKKETSKKGKAARQWELSGSNPDEFDFSKKPTAGNEELANSASFNKNIANNLSPEEMETNLEMTDTESSDEDEDEDEDDAGTQQNATNKTSKSSYFGSIWKSIGSYNKTLTQDDLRPVMDQLREHLTVKNVAAEIAEKLCESVAAKLEGQHVSTWVNLKKLARDALEEAILRILQPSRNLNILREIQAKARPPYVIVFCGVNGVGKSTNLAKIANWLMNNKVKVLVVACDTFRAGAIEQLKTHVMALKALHERGKNSEVKIELFERGYGRDSAGIAMEACNYARQNQFNCVLVDTAGRMQDNEPLMRQLAKLIKINTPDLTLFVGEALVGNEAVDQLTKFNNSLLDCGVRLQESSRSAISGIVLTKFDTIDDQVGAAISMTYTTGQPIVFCGVGQTYRDLKQLDPKAVTKALMR